MDYYQRSLKLSEELGDKSGIALSLGQIGNVHTYQGRYEQALDYYQRKLRIEEEIGGCIPCTLNNIGAIHNNQGRYELALVYYERGLTLMRELADKTGIAISLFNIASIHRMQGRYEQALDYYQRSLKLREELGDKSGIAFSLHDIGIIHSDQGGYEQALDYYQRSLKLREELGEKSGIAASLNGIGIINYNQGRYEEALDYYQRSLKLREELGDKSGIASSLNSIGNVQVGQGRYEQALDYNHQSLKLRVELGDKSGIAHSLNNIGNIQDCQGRYEQALDNYQRSLAMAKEIGEKQVIKNVLKNLSELYSKRGDFVKAYEYHKEFVAVKDSLLNEANIKSINEMRAKYESEKNEQQIALAEQQIALLEKDKTLSDLEALKNREQLRVRKLETERIRKNALLLSQQNEMNLLALNHRTTELELRTKELELQRAEKEKKAKDVEVLAKDRELQASIISRDKITKDSMLIGFVLLVLLSFLALRRLQAKRIEASLRAEAAEYQVKAAEAEVVRKEKDFQKHFTKGLIESQEHERKRVASELHDGLGQNLLVIKNQLYYITQYDTLQQQTIDRINQLSEVASTAIEEVRQLSYNLRPILLERAGITSTLYDTISKTESSSGLSFVTAIENIDEVFSTEEQINLYRIVQESLSNVLKYAEATLVEVKLKKSATSIQLLIRDDGKGFDLHTDLSKHGLGIQSIRERSEILGGSMKLESEKGRGTTIEVTIPIKRSEVEPA